MDFQGRYEILELLRDGETKTFKARQTSSGRTVLLHQIWVERTPPNQPDLPSQVFAFLRRGTGEEQKRLVDMGDAENRMFVVTEDVPACQDLRQWLQSVQAKQGTPGKPGVGTPSPSLRSSPSGGNAGQEDFTRIFSARDESKAAPPISAPGPERTPAPSLAPGGPSPSEGAGEFTRLFKGSQLPVKPHAAPPVKPGPRQSFSLPSQPGGESEAPGEFSRIFGAAQQPIRPAAAPGLPKPERAELVVPHPPPQAAAQIQAMPVAEPMAPQETPAKPEGGKSFMPLVVLGGLVLIAVVVVLFLVLKH